MSPVFGTTHGAGAVRKQSPSPPDDVSPRHRATAAYYGAAAMAFVRRVAHCFKEDNCLAGASALSFATIVSLVPVAAIVVAVFSAFPAFDDARDRFLTLLLQFFAPEVGEEISGWFRHIATSAARTTTLGIIGLIVTSLFLLETVGLHLNMIWRVTVSRHWTQRLLVYWAILTMGPVLLGAALSASSYVDELAQTAAPHMLDVGDAFRAWFGSLNRIVPFLLEAAAFAALYRLIPNWPVRWRHAAVAALFAAFLLELLKFGFFLFVSKVAYYSAVYGALAGVPIFLVWIYIFWIVVLIGAEAAARLGDRDIPADAAARLPGAALSRTRVVAVDRASPGRSVADDGNV